MGTQVPGGEQGADPGHQGVVVALGLAAGVAAGGALIGCAVDDGRLVLGVARTRGGQLRPRRFDQGAQFGGDHAADA